MSGMAETCALLSGCLKIYMQLQKDTVEMLVCLQRCVYMMSRPFSKWDKFSVKAIGFQSVKSNVLIISTCTCDIDKYV